MRQGAAAGLLAAGARGLAVHAEPKALLAHPAATLAATRARRSAGVIGAVAAPALLNGLKIRDDAIKGIAIGVAAHGIGTARAFQISAMAGAFSGLAIGLNALLTALLVPLIVKLLHLTP